MRSSNAGRRIDLIQALHAGTKRDYVGRVTGSNKAECAAVAKRYDRDYWDGERCYGYGGYRYDGRWRPVAERLAAEYGLRCGDRILDVGCGKGYLLYELTQVVPGLVVTGLDISRYAVAEAKEDIRSQLVVGDAAALPFEAASFDCVISLATLHNLPIAALWSALHEIARVSRDARGYVMVESYRNETEKMNLLYWQLTCASFFGTADWEWIYAACGYRGDYGFIFFE